MILTHQAFLAAAAPAAIPLGSRQLVRFVSVAGELLLVGGAVTVAVVALPAVARAGVSRGSEFAGRLGRRTATVLGGLGLLLLVTTLLELGYESGTAAGTGILAGLTPTNLATVLGESAEAGSWIGPGASWLVTLALTALVAVASVLLLSRPAPARRRALVGVVTVAALVTVLFPALPTTGEGLTATKVIGPVASQLHILSGGVWVGGLLMAALLLQRPARDPAVAADQRAYWPTFWQRFSGLVTVSLGVIIVSGGWLTWSHVGSWGQMLSTDYGRALSIKIVVVAVMATLGAINQVHLIPGIHRARAGGDDRSVLRLALTHFRGTVVAEAALGIVVIAIVPYLSGSARRQAVAGTQTAAGAAALDGRLVATGVAGVAVMVALFWASTRVAAHRGRPTGSARVDASAVASPVEEGAPAG